MKRQFLIHENLFKRSPPLIEVESDQENDERQEKQATEQWERRMRNQD